jgi:hypothetical protein
MAGSKGVAKITKAHTVKVRGYAVFTMILTDDESPEAVCRRVFGGRLEWIDKNTANAPTNSRTERQRS